MTPHYTDPWLTVYHGDARLVMAEMEPESVHCVVTSPPYWGLRDYGTASWIGGDETCDHKGPPSQSPSSTLLGNGHGGGKQLSPSLQAQSVPYRHTCGKCGAVRQDSQLGLEPTPEEYVENMVAVFREVRRVLRRDGTVWCNLGDSFLPGKQLAGIPWRVAFALQADGWYLRSDIIWSKPNPMPESVTDRPTKAHEYLFLLSKSPRYYYDADAVREAQRDDEATFYAKLIKQPHKGQRGKDEVNDRRTTGGFQSATFNPAGRNLRSVWTIATAPYPGAHFATFPPKLVEPCIKAGSPEGGVILDPFAGSGTTGMVAQSLSRRAVLIDLSMDYLGQLMERNRDMPLGLTS